MADRAESLLIRVKTEGTQVAAEQLHQLRKGVDTNLVGAGAAHKSFSKLGGTFDRVAGTVNNLAGYVGIGGLALGLKDAITNSQSLQTSQANLGRSIHANVRKPTEEATNQMSEYADSMSLKGGFAAPEAIQQMAQFTRVTGSQKEAMKDLALSTNIARGANVDFDRASRAVLLAEAGRTTGLSRLGISMIPVTKNLDALNSGTKTATKQQEAHAKALDANATKMKALDLIQKKYDGSTKAFTHTSAGMMQTFSNSIEILSAKVGMKLLPYLNKAAAWLGKLVDGMIHGTGEGGKLAKMASSLAGWLEKIGRFLIQNYKAILLVVGVWKAFIVVGKVMQGLAMADALFKTAQNAITAAAATRALSAAELETTDTTTGLAAAFGVLDEEMDANPMGLVVIAVAALAVGFYELWKHCKTFRQIVGAVFNALKVFAGWLKTGAIAAFHAFGAIIDWVKNHWRLLILMIGPMGLAIDFVTAHWKTFKQVVGAVINFVADRAKWVVGTLTTIWGKITSILTKPFNLAKKAISTAFNAILSVVRPIVDKISSLMSKISGPLHTLESGAGKVAHFFGFQSGGYTQGGMTLVGERGPEIVNLPRGSYVQSNPSMIGGGGGTTVIYLTLDGRVASKAIVRQGLIQQSKM
jgi:hypothetical protein